MTKIVVMGGSFNPPTIAHQRLLLGAVKELGADKGIFVPSSHTLCQYQNAPGKASQRSAAGGCAAADAQGHVRRRSPADSG